MAQAQLAKSHLPVGQTKIHRWVAKIEMQVGDEPASGASLVFGHCVRVSHETRSGEESDLCVVKFVEEQAPNQYMRIMALSAPGDVKTETEFYN